MKVRALGLSFVLLLAACGSSNEDSSDRPSTDSDVTTGDDAATDGTPDDSGSEVTPPAKPTISPFLGTNVSGDLTRVDVTYELAPFDAPMKDAHGMPAAGTSGKSATDAGFLLPTGDYVISYKGDGKVDVSGIGALAGSWTTSGDLHQATVHITGKPGVFGQFLNLTITNTGSQTVTDLHLRMPGFGVDSKEIFLPQFVALLKPFRALRFMDWEATNGSKLANWSDRPSADVYGKSENGVPWEHIVELINLTGKDAWITIPEHATDDFVTQLAKYLAKNLDFGRISAARTAQGFSTPFKLIVENSNETWNQGFSAYATFLAAAKADPTRYDGKYTGTYGPSWLSSSKDAMLVGQYEADRLVKIGKTFRTELGAVGKADIVSPVLSGWAIAPCYSDVALRFIKDHYGNPKDQITYVAHAPYFGPAEEKTTSLTDIFASATENIDGMATNFADFKKLGTEWSVGVVAYEGGQGISGDKNLPIKHLSQHDKRMYDAYLHYFDLWKKTYGDSLFMHFTLAGTPNIPEFVFQYGFWGSIAGTMEDTSKCGADLPTLTGTEPIDSVVHKCPKYRALMEQVP
jgi:hypothetical protein